MLKFTLARWELTMILRLCNTTFLHSLSKEVTVATTGVEGNPPSIRNGA
jgi:hypothetical protein